MTANWERLHGRVQVVVVVGAVAALLVVLATSSSAPAASSRLASASRAAEKVAIRNFVYLPRTLRIAKGTKVVFANFDGAPHTATDKGVFDTGRIRRGRSAAVVFKRKGIFPYICTIHPWMHGKIVVG